MIIVKTLTGSHCMKNNMRRITLTIMENGDVYLMYQLKRAGISQCDLIRVYTSVVRPILEYACPAWHTNLPKYLSDNIELIPR